MNRKVIVTGASGFIGRHTLPFLAQRGFEIHAFSRRRQPHLNIDIPWYSIDLMNEDELRQTIEKIRPTHLLHLAWYAEPGLFWSAEENLDWVKISLELFKQFRIYGGKRMVMAGSCAEYEWGHKIYSEETTPVKPKALYGNCKHAVEQILHEFSKTFGLSSACGRIFYVYGPHERTGRLVSSVVQSLLNDEEALCSEGYQEIDILYVKDVAEAFVAILDSEIQGPVNIASGISTKVRDVVTAIGKKTQKNEKIQFGALKPKDPQMSFVGDNTRLSRELGWSARYDLSQGLDETIQWWQENMGLKTVEG